MKSFGRIPCGKDKQIEVSFAHNASTHVTLAHFCLLSRVSGEYKVLVYELPSYKILYDERFTDDEKVLILDFCKLNESSLLMQD